MDSDTDSGSSSGSSSCETGKASGTGKKTTGGAAKKAANALRRLSAVSRNVQIRVEPTKRFPAACVAVAFPLRANPLVLALLRGGGTGSFDGDDVDSTIVAYAAFDKVFQELLGNPKNAASSKAMSVSCGCTDAEFIISVTCAPSFAVAKRCACIIARNLKFSSLSSMYRFLCGTLNIKPSSEGFAYAVNECNKAVDASLSVVMTGKVKAKDKETVEIAAESVESKLKDLQDKEGAKKRAVESTQGKIEMVEMAVPSNMDATLVKSFVDEFTTGSILAGNTLFIPSRFESALSKLPRSPKVDAFAGKMAGLKDDLGGVLAYTAARDCGVNTSQIRSDRSYTLSDIKKVINDSLKA